MKLSSRAIGALLLLAAPAFAVAQQAPIAKHAPRVTEPTSPRAPKIHGQAIAHDLWEAPLHVAPAAPLEPIAATKAIEAMSHVAQAKSVTMHTTSPRPSWAPLDTADSLYRIGREALNRSEYRPCARVFRELRDKHPRSQYVADASYWEAFCLYRIGTMEDLRTAREVLRTAQTTRYSQASMQADAVALASRVRTALARRGDPEAINESRTAAQQGATCDSEEMSVRVEALSALASTDDQAAMPAIRKVLANRDACTRELRARAISILVRKPDTSALPVLLDVIRNDPETPVRRTAVQALSRVPGSRADQAIQEVLRTSADEEVQMAAVGAMAQRDDWRGLRALIERDDVRLELRRAALSGISRERTTPEDAEWLRTMYGRVAEVTLKEAIVSTIGRLGGETNEQWLVSIARNGNEPVRARTSAIQRLARSQVATAEFVRIFDAATERQMREYLVRLLGERGDTVAIDKLVDIARSSTDPVVRRSAVNALTRYRDNPKVRKLFEDLIG